MTWPESVSRRLAVGAALTAIAGGMAGWQTPFSGIVLMLDAALAALLVGLSVRRIRWLRLAAFNLLPIFLFLAVVETVLLRPDRVVSKAFGDAMTRPDRSLGYFGVPDASGGLRLVMDDAVLAEGHYHTDAVGRRRTPEGDWPSVAVLGCSMAFGQLLDDAATLPWRLGELSGRRVFNLAVPGYGAHEPLAMLEDDGRWRELTDAAPVELVLYLAIDDHVKRTALLAPWEPLYAPHYRIAGDSLVRGGVAGRLLGFKLLGRLLPNTTLFIRKALFSRGRNVDDRRALRLYLAVVEAMRKRVEAAGARFVVLFYDSTPESTVLIEALRRQGEMVVPVSSLLAEPLDNCRYVIPHDSHPAAGVWREAVPHLLERLALSPGRADKPAASAPEGRGGRNEEKAQKSR